MEHYHHFAKYYAAGPYTHFSKRMTETLIPKFIQDFQFTPKTLLDLACGEGTFALAMAEEGIDVTGLDASGEMLEIARRKEPTNGSTVKWVQGDMRHLYFDTQFDLVTCFFDSLNYLLQVDDLNKAFNEVYKILRPGGYFLFDMNTLYGLEVEWQRFPYFIQQEQPEFMEIHANTCDYENGIASVRIIIFEKQGDSWYRFEEIHQERGYACEDIVLLLENCGFEVLHLLGNPENFRPIGTHDGRVWVISRKPL